MLRFSPNLNRAHLIRWVEWGDEAFQQAQRQGKPLMLYLGAFWCGICQRFDETALSSDENIALLNAYFVPIKVENAQRPDIDIRYSQNGWPTIVFLTPEGEQMASVNYLPAEEFGTALAKIHLFYRDRKEELGEAIAKAYSEFRPEAAHRKPIPVAASESVASIRALVVDSVDKVHGGYGGNNKFPHAEANEFLLDCYESTGDAGYLEHVVLTLDKMGHGKIRDERGGGFFRYSSKADWSEPHREKLLCDQAGILGNLLRLFSMTHRPAFRQMAEGIIAYLDTELSDPNRTAFYGCQDYIRIKPGSEEFFSVKDTWIYTDANAQTAGIYLEAASVLGRSDCKERALRLLDFLLQRCRHNESGMFHYFDGIPMVPGLLMDQVYMGLALLKAHAVTKENAYLDRAEELAEYVVDRFKNSRGGYHDVCFLGPALLRFRLTLIEQNGLAAKFFLKIAQATRKQKYRDAALWACAAFTEDFADYGIHAAIFGRALIAYLRLGGQ